MSTSALSWFKSSYSSGSGDNCIEVALDWHKSSYSGSSGDNCVEVATCPSTVHVRDSKDKEGPQLAFTPAEWAHFVEFARAAVAG
ncbi:DUF397 domain-containing protein [Streptomyces sp. NPDC020917]|uniref:DUF397 domain-containing protein n=1 Tax=Streptomyces sp. NPDC020917 TaxID=3365102 RepID=UPI0037AD14D0